jgi:hypothetical protein
MKKIILSLIALVGLVTSIGLAPSMAKAQGTVGAGGVQVSPTRIDWTFNLGDEKVGQINLKNYTNETMKVEVQAEDFTVNSDSTEAQFFVPDNTHPLKAYDVIKWISFESGASPIITIPPEQSVDFKFKVKVPTTTATGGYYGAVFFRTLPSTTLAQPGSNTSVIGVSERVGTLLLMGVRGVGAVEQKGSIESLTLSKSVYGTSPVQIDTRFKNTGNMFFPVHGTIKIQKFGSDVKDFTLDSRMTYPGKNRLYTTQWEFGNWSFGQYKAIVEMKSEDGTITDTAEASFWVIPYKTTIILVILIVLIIAGVIIVGKRFELKSKK